MNNYYPPSIAAQHTRQLIAEADAHRAARRAARRAPRRIRKQRAAAA